MPGTASPSARRSSGATPVRGAAALPGAALALARRRPRLGPAAALAAIALLALLPTPALAGTLSRTGAVLFYTAAAGEGNAVGVEVPEQLLVTDSGAPVAIDPASGCTPVDPAQPSAGAQCPLAGTAGLVVNLGDGDDRLTAEEGVTLPLAVSGGAGADLVEAGAGPDALGGDAGNDTLVGAGGADDIRGGDGDDLLRGAGGNDRHEGGAGDDRIDARIGGGTDTIVCAAPGDDRIIRGTTDRLEGCGERPRARLSVPRQRIEAFLEDGFELRVTCQEPCAIAYEFTARDRATRRRIHSRDRRLAKSRPLDREAFPRYLPAGRNTIEAKARGRATRRDLGGSLPVLRLRLEVTVTGRNSLETTIVRNLTVRR